MSRRSLNIANLDFVNDDAEMDPYDEDQDEVELDDDEDEPQDIEDEAEKDNDVDPEEQEDAAFAFEIPYRFRGGRSKQWIYTDVYTDQSPYIWNLGPLQYCNWGLYRKDDDSPIMFQAYCLFYFPVDLVYVLGLQNGLWETTKSNKMPDIPDYTRYEYQTLGSPFKRKERSDFLDVIIVQSAKIQRKNMSALPRLKIEEAINRLSSGGEGEYIYGVDDLSTPLKRKIDFDHKRAIAKGRQKAAQQRVLEIYKSATQSILPPSH